MGTVYPTDVFVACLNEGGWSALVSPKESWSTATLSWTSGATTTWTVVECWYYWCHLPPWTLQEIQISRAGKRKKRAWMELSEAWWSLVRMNMLGWSFFLLGRAWGKDIVLWIKKDLNILYIHMIYTYNVLYIHTLYSIFTCIFVWYVFVVVRVREVRWWFHWSFLGWKSRHVILFGRLPFCTKMFLQSKPKGQKTAILHLPTSLGKDSCGITWWKVDLCLLSNSQSGRNRASYLTITSFARVLNFIGKQRTHAKGDCMSQCEPVHSCQFDEYKSMYPIYDWQVRLVFGDSRWWLFFLRPLDSIKPFIFVALIDPTFLPFSGYSRGWYTESQHWLVVSTEAQEIYGLHTAAQRVLQFSVGAP